MSDETICLVGNVNVGKSTIFNGLADKKQNEVISPGTSVSYNTSTVRGKESVLVDPPGINSLIVSSEDEKVSRNLIVTRKVDKIIQVLDAHNMIRSISLALQFSEFEIPTIFVLNKDDMAQIRGISVDAEKLSVLFGVKVIRAVAREKQGIAALKDALEYSSVPKKLLEFPKDIEIALQQIADLLDGKVHSPRGEALLMLTDDTYMKRNGASVLNPVSFKKCQTIKQELEAQRRKPINLVLSELFMFHATRLVAEFQQKKPVFTMPFMTVLGRQASQLPIGIPMALAVFFLMYLFVGKLGAEYLVGFIEGRIFEGFIVPEVSRLVDHMGLPWLTEMFCGEFGLVSMGLNLAFGVLLPVLLTFYVFYGLMEDSGYLQRLSILLNNVFRKMGMNGKGVMPLIMGFSCITMAIMTARMLDTKKERFVISLLLSLGIPCAPLFAVMFVIFAKLHWSAMLVVFGTIVIKVLLAGVIINKLIPGRYSGFIIEVPTLRIPDIQPIIRRAVTRLVFFLKEAVPVFLLASLGLFAFDRLGGLDMVRTIADPAAKWLLGLPEHSVEILVMTLVRREAGAALLDQFFGQGYFNGVQAVVMLIVMTSLLPCVNAVIVLFKERGWKQATSIVTVVIPTAIITGTLVNYMCILFNISFIP
ncbi:MAG: ferrous iron transporter B [Proteobacteria bacterium]|nr:ferrous iron transporter B [Pseudomonadota bacterium]